MVKLHQRPRPEAFASQLQMPSQPRTLRRCLTWQSLKTCQTFIILTPLDTLLIVGGQLLFWASGVVAFWS